MYRMNIIILLTAILIPALTINPVSAQDREALKVKALKTGYNMLLSEVDKNNDGKISLDECLSPWKDKATGESKCKYWDKNGDGIITEEEYVQQGLKIMK
ncbi:MAG: EF-hand domain-containing protein [Nitrospirota bacterium]